MAIATGVVALVSRVYDQRVADRVTSTVPHAEVMDLLREERAWHLVLVLLLMALAAGIAVWLARRVSAPLRRLQEQTRIIAHGEHSDPIPEEGPAELRALATHFNQMAAAVAAREADLTKANAELVRSETIFRGIFDNTSDLVTLFRVPADGGPLVCDDANRATLIGTGFSLQQVIGGTFYTHLPKDEAGWIESRFREAATTRQPVVYERRVVLNTGERWFNTVVIPIPAVDGTIAHVASVSRDLTEHEKSERALRESEAFLAGLIESAIDAVVAVDHLDTVLLFNPAAEQIFGVSASEAFGRSVMRFLPDGLSIVSARSPSVVAQRADGTTFPAEVSASVLAAGGREIHAAIVRDVSERAEHDEAVRRQAAELERRVADRTAQLAVANDELESFAYAVSHDLRAPLRKINGFVHALVHDCADQLDDVGRDHLRRVHASSGQMGELIDDLLTLSQAARGELRRTSVNLSVLADQVVQGLRANEPVRSVAVTVQSGIMGMGDLNLLRVVLENLLGNAWKYTARTVDARIDFGMEERDGEPVYFVRDNGAGFEMAYVGKLFQPFQRLHRSDEFEGHGIGLATVRRVIHRHGGRTWAEGAVGKGATVYFTLESNR